ncbi:hypothetical protein LEP1GSC056_1180 [Leptospira borgpetersenii str. Brem 328]|uniref:Uncharacterized protein n=1 Tax=Leptospira borgpetersenii str. Brem 328 TaxID=1049780 RepID=A0ABC9SLY4_LEPBO|nr:hypothetical protein LEP1GSC056_1180 [Leptospira borgpetersenii str. Brem 328]
MRWSERSISGSSPEHSKGNEKFFYFIVDLFCSISLRVVPFDHHWFQNLCLKIRIFLEQFF